jgi:hypothetical protein
MRMRPFDRTLQSGVTMFGFWPRAATVSRNSPLFPQGRRAGRRNRLRRRDGVSGAARIHGGLIIGGHQDGFSSPFYLAGVDGSHQTPKVIYPLEEIR